MTSAGFNSVAMLATSYVTDEMHTKVHCGASRKYMVIKDFLNYSAVTI